MPGRNNDSRIIPPYLNSDATSMINGISREKPALDLFRRIEMAWSLYEMMGDRIRKRGAR